MGSSNARDQFRAKFQLDLVAFSSTSSMSSQNNTGFAFGFKLPSEGLALRSVAIESGTPKLIFDAALKTPTLTEEDVGIACRLACEGKQPEFFYYGIPTHHPYHGRQYKHYSPQWLRGTSIGELLSEADWTMKCLNIGARSDKAKERFWAWQETSKLEGLAAIFDFPDDKPPGSVMMTCDSVEVQKTDSGMVFLNEPKMKITDESSSSYTKYITDIYPSIAFYDEPLLLKMQELIKLILAVEWLKENGVRFSRPWMIECSAPQSHKASQAIEVKSKGLGEDEIRDILDNLVKQLPETSHQEVMTSLGSFTVDKAVETTIAENGIEVKVTTTVLPSSLTSPEVKETTIIRASVNDYDMLYSGMDPNMPILPELPGHSKKIVPNVGSWTELFAETVPWPRIWKKPHEMDVILSASGGVRTSNIPVNEPVAACAQSHIHVKVPSREAERIKVPVEVPMHQGPYVAEGNGKLGVLAQRGKKEKEKAEKVPSNMVPSSSTVVRPDNNVTSKTQQTVRNKKQRYEEGFGWEDVGGGQKEVCNRKGDMKVQQRSMRSSVHHRTEVNGKVVRDARYGRALAPSTTVTQTTNIGQESQSTKSTTKHKKKTTVGRRAEKRKSKALDTNNTPPVQLPLPSLSLDEEPKQQQQQVARPAHVTPDLFSPTGSATSQDSGFVSLPDRQQNNLQEGENSKPIQDKENRTLRSGTSAHPSTLPLKEQPAQQQVAMAPPAGVTNDLFSPDGSVVSNDSGFGEGQERNHPNNGASALQAHLPHHSLQEQQQATQPARATDLFSPTSSVASKDSGFESIPDGQQNNIQEGESSELAKDKDDGASDGSSDSGNDSPDDRMDTN